MKTAKLLALAGVLLASSAAAFWLYKNESQLHITAPLDLSRAGSSVSLEFRARTNEPLRLLLELPYIADACFKNQQYQGRWLHDKTMQKSIQNSELSAVFALEIFQNGRLIYAQTHNGALRILGRMQQHINGREYMVYLLETTLQFALPAGIYSAKITNLSPNELFNNIPTQVSLVSRVFNKF